MEVLDGSSSSETSGSGGTTADDFVEDAVAATRDSAIVLD